MSSLNQEKLLKTNQNQRIESLKWVDMLKINVLR
jgi:hypothetical protein